MIVLAPNVGAPQTLTPSKKVVSAMPNVDTSGRTFSMIDNYVYLYHTDTFIILPIYPDSVMDSMGASFSPTTPLSRSAPIYSYQNSGPRTVSFSMTLQREMMSQVNWQKSNATVELGDDYIDTLIKQLDASVLPEYAASSKMVNPPIVAVRFGSDIFCKGVVTSPVSKTFGLPIITDSNGNDKYSIVTIGFTVNEIDPYDASTVMTAGSFRGLSTTLERNLWKSTDNASNIGAYGTSSTYQLLGQ